MFTCTYRYTVALKPHSPAKHTICMWAGSFISFLFRCFSECYIHILHSLQYISDWYYLTIKPWHTCRGASVWPSGAHPRTSHVHMLILLHWKSQDTAKWQCLQPGDNSIYQPGIVTHTHTHVDTHDLPGLGHSAAVTATALRASSHPQLLSRLTAIKVVCEFPKTRHLFRLSLNSTSPSLLFFSLIFLMLIRKIRKDSLLQSSTVHDLLTYSLPCSTSTWIQLCSLALAAGPTSPVLLHPFLPEHLCRRTRALPFPASNSPFDPSAAAHGACTLILLK